VRRVSRNNWPVGTPIPRLRRKTAVSTSFASGLTTSIIRCWLISVMNPWWLNLIEDWSLVMTQSTADMIYFWRTTMGQSQQLMM